jgi:hypothetical protein
MKIHLSPQTIEHKKDYDIYIYDVGNPAKLIKTLIEI